MYIVEFDLQYLQPEIQKSCSTIQNSNILSELIINNASKFYRVLTIAYKTQ
jgi:hypothetical protein